MSADSARVALMNFKRKGISVDPDDTQHQEAYIQMRSKFQRVSSEQFVKYLGTARTDVMAGAKSEMLWWAVPKANFPRGLPRPIKDAEATAEELSAAGGVECDQEEYFVIDQCVSRDKLGKNVWIVGNHTGTMTKYQHSGPAMAPPAAHRSTSGPATGAPAITDSGEQAVVASRAAGQRRLRQNPSEAFSPSGGEEVVSREDPAARAATLLTQTLLTLKRNIEAANDAKVWVAANALNNNSVYFWAQETVGTLEEMVRDAGHSNNKSKSEAVVLKFVHYFLSLAQNAEVYPDWCSFKGLFPRLIAAGGPAIPAKTADEAVLLERLAATKVDSDEPVDTSRTTALSRAHFFNTPLYRSFVLNRANRAVEMARTAATGATRTAALLPWKSSQSLPSELSQTIDTALNLFNEQSSYADRIVYMLDGRAEDEDKSDTSFNPLMKMALHWDPTGPMGVAARICQATPDLADVSYDQFANAIMGIDGAEREERICNPIVKMAVSLWREVNDWEDAPKHRLLHHALHERLGIKLPVTQEGQPQAEAPNAEFITGIPKDELSGVAKRVRDFFRGSASPPEWTKEIEVAATAASKLEKEAREAAKAQAKAAKAEAAAAASATGAPGEDGATGEGATSATGATGATGEGAAASADAAAADAGAEAGEAFTKDMEVTVSFGRGDNGYNGATALVTAVLTHHCWVSFLDGPKKDEKKKVVKTNLKPKVQELPATGGTAPPEEVAPPPVEDADEHDDWSDARDVFG